MNRREFVKSSMALAGTAAAFSLCSAKGFAAESKDTSGAAKEGTKKMSNKCMVVYFSWSGNTRFAAETIAKKADADLFEITAAKPYPSDFQKCCDEAGPECRGKKERPVNPIDGLDLAKYDVVFVGSPNWWGTLAPPVRTWIVQNRAALKGKSVCLFQTHGGGGMQNLGRDFAEAVGDGATVLAPKAFPGRSIKNSVKELESFAASVLAAARGSADNCQTDVFKTNGGKEVVFTAIKHASMRIQYDGLEIQVDPVAEFAPATDYSTFPKADVILVTHEHFDHFDRGAIAALKKDTTEVIANPAVQKMLGFGVAMTNGESRVTAKGIKLDAVLAYNTTPGHTQFHPKGRDNGYVLTIDGLRIYIAGDTEDIPEMANLKDIDVAFLPCNQPYTMTPEQVAKATRTIKPKVLFPYHYSQTPVKRVVELLAGSGIDVRIRNYQ